ncbi:kunitz-type protease inhibitor 2 isoform X1 [Lampris incognitus]|uniref:kunitz-type protease inhibitor 2 isoform X1 n=1 Tax=Lampris incognitus TaxID=2546036 RepID=UPI0024B4EAD8|nr:kunitz-type protease inhibitor 2 isoform X1 [Lampris incognitus]
MAVRYVIFSLLLSLLPQMSSGRSCDWQGAAEPNRGLDPRALEAGARHLLLLEEVTDMERCRQECCAHPECQVAMLAYPQDTGPQCILVGCQNQRGEDVCAFQPDEQSEISRIRTRTRQSPDGELPVAPARVQNSTNATNATNTDRCRQPMKVGSCRAAFPSFYYNVTNQTCKIFIYGGCEANGNNFNSEEECLAACSGVTGTVLPDDSAPQSHSKPGPRMSAPLSDIPVLSKDVEANSSHNKTERSATDTIPTEETGSTTPVAALLEMSALEYAEMCEAKPKVGPCRAALRHWYHDGQTRTCKTFIYGGCRGNKNNYVTEESCRAACTVTVIPSSRKVQTETQTPNAEDQAAKDYKEYCAPAADTGPCRAAFTMYYYQPSTGTCQTFIYGGCRGNNNRYRSLEECTVRCSGQQGSFEERGHGNPRDHWTPAFFLVGTLAVISVLLLSFLVLIMVRRVRLPRRASSVSDKEELLPEPDEQSSLESLSVQGSPKVGQE